MIWWMERRRAAETDGGELISWELVHLWLSADTWSAGLKYNCHSQRTISGLGEALQWKMLVCQWVQLFRLSIFTVIRWTADWEQHHQVDSFLVLGVKMSWHLLDRISWTFEAIHVPQEIPHSLLFCGCDKWKKKRNVHTLHNLIVFKSFTSQMSLKHLSRMRATKQPQQQQHCGNSGYLTFD